MSNWSVKNLGEAIFAEESLDNIKSLFLSEFDKAHNPEDMAIFLRRETEGRLHCEAKVYFSPASIGVANKVDAIPCIKPSLNSLEFIAGSDQAWSVLFSKKGF